MTAIATLTMTAAELAAARNRQADHDAAVRRCAVILRRLRRILKRDGVLNDASFAPEWEALAAMLALQPNDWHTAIHLRDRFATTILPELRDEKQIRVQYARVLSLLNDFVWIWLSVDARDSWPTVRQIGEDF